MDKTKGYFPHSFLASILWCLHRRLRSKSGTRSRLIKFTSSKKKKETTHDSANVSPRILRVPTPKPKGEDGPVTFTSAPIDRHQKVFIVYNTHSTTYQRQALEQIIVLALRGLKVEEPRIPSILQEIKKMGARSRSLIDASTVSAMVCSTGVILFLFVLLLTSLIDSYSCVCRVISN